MTHVSYATFDGVKVFPAGTEIFGPYDDGKLQVEIGALVKFWPSP